jgi:outer membrane protein assembly factor BamE (lipoprotein component of BamABCDE complex)
MEYEMKKVTQSGFFVVLGLLLLSGCMTTGNGSLKHESPESISKTLQEGLTTREQLIEIMGAPMETTFTDSGLEVLKYEYTKLKPSLRNFIPYNIVSRVSEAKKKELVVLLDQDSLVKKLVMNVSDEQVRFGIIE